MNQKKTQTKERLQFNIQSNFNQVVAMSIKQKVDSGLKIRALSSFWIWIAVAIMMHLGTSVPEVGAVSISVTTRPKFNERQLYSTNDLGKLK